MIWLLNSQVALFKIKFAEAPFSKVRYLNDSREFFLLPINNVLDK